MGGVVLCRGRGLVIDYANDEATAIMGTDIVGIPFSEAFTGPQYGALVAAMRRVLTGHRAEAVPWFSGLLWVVPLAGAVALHFSPLAPHHAGLRGAAPPAPAQ